MELVWFTLVGLGIFLLSNTILERIEQRRGKTLEYRSVVFFFIFLTLALTTFELINYLDSNINTAPTPAADKAQQAPPR